MMRLRDALFARGLNKKSVVWGEGVITPQDSVVTIDIPDGITEIGSSAFYDSAALSGAVATESVKILNTGAFAKCPLLTSVSFPGVEYIGQGCFSECSGLVSISGKFPKVKFIDNGAFSGTKLSEFDFPNAVKLGDGIVNTGTIKSINLPKVVHFGHGNLNGMQLQDDNGLIDIELPECTYIGDGCLSGVTCDRLILPEIETIGNSFTGCTFKAIILSNPDKVCEWRYTATGSGETWAGLVKDDTRGWFYVRKHLKEAYQIKYGYWAGRFRAIEDYPEITGG